MSKAWKDLKSEINDHVAQLKADLEKAHAAEYKDKTVQALVKIKDNAKVALVTLVHSKIEEAKLELQIDLEDSKNLKKRFADLLKSFNAQVK